MTNGEKVQIDFNCEVCEPIFEDDIIHVIFADKKDSAIGFDWSWWIAEYKEPTTKRCESCRYYSSYHEVCNYCYNCSLWTEGEPTTKNNLGVDCIERQKYFAYLDGVADGLNESRNDVSEVLDKIRKEIENIELLAEYTRGDIKRMALDVIDKYKVEIESQESEDKK